MVMAKAPAFQLYAADFYMDTNHWSVDELGIYQRLLLTEWTNKGLPNDEKRLARIAGCSYKKFQKGWGIIKIKFHLNGEGQFVNDKMEKIRILQMQYSEKQREKGKKRANKMWEGHIAVAKTTAIKRLSTRLQPEDSPSSSSSSSSSSSLKKKNIYIFSSSDFETFWKTYPKKVGKTECIEHFKSNKFSEWDLLQVALENYKLSKTVKDGYVRDPIRFLKKDYWKDWIQPEKDLPQSYDPDIQKLMDEARKKGFTK